MPLPDADKRSPRVYTNLQNLNLDDVTFANVQSTGNPINVEEVNEDELRRLVLVNLARLVCAGEWNGLLTAASGGEQAYQIPSAVCGATGQYKYWNLANMWAGTVGATQQTLNLTSESQFFNPFIAPQTGAPAGCSIYVSTATSSQNLYVGFYGKSSAGYPETLLGYGTISTDSTGAIRVTSFTEASTGSLTFTKGEMYYYSFHKSGTENPVLASIDGDLCATIVPDNVVDATGGSNRFIESVSTTTSAPANIAATTDIQGSGTGGHFRCQVWLDF